MSAPTIRICDGSVTVLRDGTLSLDVGLFSGADSAADFAAGPIEAAANAFLYRAGDTLMLIDAGGGGMLPGTGGMQAQLNELGVAPEEIDVVFCTHLHPDHIGGLMRDYEAVFTNSAVWINDAEIAFWGNADIKAAAPPEAQVLFETAICVFEQYGTQIHPFSGTQNPLPNVSTMPLPGHTPGHTGLIIGDGPNGLFVWGDIVHAEALQLALPHASIAFDVDPAQAVATRLDTFEHVTQEGLRVAGGHLSAPGFGRIRKQGAGYVFDPETL